MQAGTSQNLTVIGVSHDLITLDGDNLGPIPLPLSESPYLTKGDSVSAFIYTDAEARPLATTKKPYVEAGRCACLKVVDVNNAGAFLDWGLPKNLLLPFAEQRRPVEIGQQESVLVYQDNSGRLAASSRLDHHLPDISDHYQAWQAVSLLLYQRTQLGFKCVVNHHAIGLLYKDEIFQTVRVGETRPGFVKRIRDDGRLDLALQPPSHQLQPELTTRILEYLHQQGGTSELCDSSSPAAIKAAFQVSKKNFKRALSTLYKERRIVIETDGIRLNNSYPDP